MVRSRQWFGVLLGVSVVLQVGCQRGSVAVEDTAGHAERLAHQILILDSHVDLPYRLQAGFPDLAVRSGEDHFDFPRAREGGLDAVFMAAYVPASLQGSGHERARADELIDLVERVAATWPEEVVIARSSAEVRSAFAAGRIALPLGIENGAPILTLEDLDHFHTRGVRYITLTHSENNLICDSSFADGPQWNGLSPYGREVVAAMNRLGIMVDVSHVSDEAFDQVIELTRAPVIASHSSCRAFVPDLERNLDDGRIKRLAEGGGVIQINFAPGFLTAAAWRHDKQQWDTLEAFIDEHGLSWDSPEVEEESERYLVEHPRVPTSVKDVADHIDHVVKLVGIDHVGLGSDFEGIEYGPSGLEDVSDYPNLIAELLRRGYTEADIRKICGENLLRVWSEVERAAVSL